MNIDVPFNVVPRKILNMLTEAGVKIVAPEKGMENATKAIYSPAHISGKVLVSRELFSKFAI